MSIHNDPAHDVESKSGAFAGVLGSKEGIKDPRYQLRWDTRAVISNLDDYDILCASRPDGNLPSAFIRVDGVVNQIGPHLVQLSPVRSNWGHILVVVAQNLDSLPELVSKNQKRLFDAVVDVDLLLRGPIHV